MSKAFEALMKSAFNEAVKVNRNHAERYFKEISKYLGGNGGFELKSNGVVDIWTGWNPYTDSHYKTTLYFDPSKSNDDTLVLTAVERNGEKVKISEELKSIKEVPMFGSQLDKFFNKVKPKNKQGSSGEKKSELKNEEEPQNLLPKKDPKNNESYEGVTISNTIFGKMLERAGVSAVLESDDSVEIEDYKTGWSQNSFGQSSGAMKGSVEAIVDGKYRVWVDLALNKAGKVKSAREYFNSKVEDMKTKQTVNDTALIRKLITKIVKALKSED